MKTVKTHLGVRTPPLSGVTGDNLDNLRKATHAYHLKWQSVGREFTTYKCQHCKKNVRTPRPREQDVGSAGCWTTAKVCYLCGRMNMVVTYPDGRTVVNGCC